MNVKIIWGVMRRAPNLQILAAHASFFRMDSPTSPVWDPTWDLPPLEELYLSSFTALSLFFQSYTPTCLKLRMFELDAADIEEKETIQKFVAACPTIEHIRLPDYSDDSDL